MIFNPETVNTFECCGNLDLDDSIFEIVIKGKIKPCTESGRLPLELLNSCGSCALFSFELGCHNEGWYYYYVFKNNEIFKSGLGFMNPK